MPAHRSLAAVSLALALALAGRPAAAEEPQPPAGAPDAASPQSTHATTLERLDAPRENVWSKGVPEEARRAADTLFLEGNALLRESICGSAAAKYRQALGRWDHPNIHYNLALALMTLDQPVETYQQLQAATHFGAAPLGQERFEHARNYLVLLEQQLARVKISAAVEGAKVELDGQPLFTAPGAYDGLVKAGRHTVVATKEGYVTNSSVRVLEGGETAVIDLQLNTMEELTERHRRWPVWKPWAVVAAGATVALAGGALHRIAIRRNTDLDRESRNVCPEGCDSEPGNLSRERNQARNYQRAAVGAYAVGGAALVTGGILVFLNRGQTRVRTYDQGGPATPPPGALRIEPVLDPERPGLLATIRF